MSSRAVYTLTLDEVFLPANFSLRHGRQARAATMFFGFSFALVLLGLWIGNIPMILFSLTLDAIWLPSVYKRFFRKSPTFADPKLFLERQISISAKGYEEKAPFGEQKALWSGFESYAEVDGGLLLFVNSTMAKIVPRRVFSAEEWAQVMQAVSAALPPATRLTMLQRIGLFFLGLILGSALIVFTLVFV